MRKYTLVQPITLYLEVEVSVGEINAKDRADAADHSEEQYPEMVAASYAAERIALAALKSLHRINITDYDWGEQDDLYVSAGDELPPRFPAPARADVEAVASRWVSADPKRRWVNGSKCGVHFYFEGRSFAYAGYSDDPDKPDPADFRNRLVRDRIVTLAAFEESLP